ncbi:type III PLP-dependent enzyme [Roseovarius sp. EL26]|uniref:type III PLP-dependent enzyme n=1 Tax=Roseovarius sp. EL26 TaxID=2126672 RepID=UPI000EA2D908|nr:type III PLP-dependent enzyme [Roseovarius sp. EL26]
MRNTPHWNDPISHLRRQQPDTVSLYFSPTQLQATAQRFLDGFDGLVTYAVKANPGEEVLANLVAAGVRAFDVASPQEMQAVRRVFPDAVLHYNNPVRSPKEVALAAELGVASYSVDCARELEKIASLVKDVEISIRLALPIKGAVYDFGEKFGAGPDEAAKLLRRIVELGFTPAMTFHPGTQCADPTAWGCYIAAVADVAKQAGVSLARLNVGGGFAAHRVGDAPDLEAIFDHIRRETDRCFGTDAPELVCEPGRAMVADAFSLAARVKAIRPGGAVFINDGIYGGFSEGRDMMMVDRIRIIDPQGHERAGRMSGRVVYGPTCDSIDRLPDPVALPDDIAEGDYILFDGMGAYSRAINTGFNGYGLGEPVTVTRLN